MPPISRHQPQALVYPAGHPSTQPGVRSAVPPFIPSNILPIGDAGALRALVDVKIGPLLVRRFRVIQQEGQAPWVSPPAESWKDSEGKTRYRLLLDLPEHWKAPLTAAVLSAWQEFLATGIQPDAAVIGGRER